MTAGEFADVLRVRDGEDLRFGGIGGKIETFDALLGGVGRVVFGAEQIGPRNIIRRPAALAREAAVDDEFPVTAAEGPVPGAALIRISSWPGAPWPDRPATPLARPIGRRSFDRPPSPPPRTPVTRLTEIPPFSP
jgi:hypothetical protein